MLHNLNSKLCLSHHEQAFGLNMVKLKLKNWSLSLPLAAVTAVEVLEQEVLYISKPTVNPQAGLGLGSKRNYEVKPQNWPHPLNNALLVKVEGPVWYTICHQLPIVKG